MRISKLLRLGVPALILAAALTACTGTIAAPTPAATPDMATGSVTESESMTETAPMTATADLVLGSADAISATVGNLTYTGIYTDAVTLTDGTYTGEPFVPDGALRPTVKLIQVAAGDLNGDGAEDAAVLLMENSGGSGSFVYLAAVVDDAGTMTNVATILLGDRWQINSFTVTDGQIALDALRQGENDPLCCPSENVVQHYMLQDGQLVLTDETVTSGG